VTNQRGRKLVWTALLIATCGVSSPAETIRAITGASTILAIYTESAGVISSPSPGLVVVAFEDGHILWSQDGLNGGPPYREAQIEPARIQRVLSRLDEDGLFELADLEDPRFGPDSSFTTVLVKSGVKKMEMRSWHELVEGSGGIARKVGVVSDDRPRLEVLRHEPQDYLFYRFVWEEVRGRALSLIPAGGQPVEGEVLSSSRELSWREGERARK
jgi:hypothetical protein